VGKGGRDVIAWAWRALRRAHAATLSYLFQSANHADFYLEKRMDPRVKLAECADRHGKATDDDGKATDDDRLITLLRKTSDESVRTF
jgi:hypothetical protein